MVLQRSANRFLKSFGAAYAVKDVGSGQFARKVNSLGVARAIARRLSIKHRGAKFNIWTGRGFTVSVNISYRDGRRGR